MEPGTESNRQSVSWLDFGCRPARFWFRFQSLGTDPLWLWLLFTYRTEPNQTMPAPRFGHTVIPFLFMLGRLPLHFGVSFIESLGTQISSFLALVDLAYLPIPPSSCMFLIRMNKLLRVIRSQVCVVDGMFIGLRLRRFWFLVVHFPGNYFETSSLSMHETINLNQIDVTMHCVLLVSYSWLLISQGINFSPSRCQSSSYTIDEIKQLSTTREGWGFLTSW